MLGTTRSQSTATYGARGNLTLAIFAKGFNQTRQAVPLTSLSPLLLQLLLPKGDCAIECQNAHKLRKCRRSRRRRAAKKCSQRREQSMKRETERGRGKSSAAGAGLHLGRGVGVVSLPSLAARSSRSAAFLFFLRSLSRAYKIHTLHFSTETRRGPRPLPVPASLPFLVLLGKPFAKCNLLLCVLLQLH